MLMVDWGAYWHGYLIPSLIISVGLVVLVGMVAGLYYGIKIIRQVMGMKAKIDRERGRVRS